MKKVIRITESDLRKIINRIVENSPLDIAKDTVMLGVFGDNPQNTPPAPAENNSGEAEAIKKAGELGVNSGEWARRQVTSPTIQLSYKKSPNDNRWIELAQVNAPKHIKRTNGKWSISNNKLTITD